MKITSATFFSLLALSASCGAEIAHPDWPFDVIDSSETKIPPATSISLGELKIVLEKTTFSEVLKIFPAPLSQHGDASEFEMSLCYTLSSVHQRAWLTSSELGGKEYIDGLIAIEISNGQLASESCPELPIQYQSLRLDHGVEIGAPIESFESTLGVPRNAGKGTFYYSYLGKAGDFDISSVLVLRAKDEKINQIYAGHSSTD